MSDLDRAKHEFESFLQTLSPASRTQFLAWTRDKIDSGDWGDVSNVKSNEDVVLESIQEDLRSELPINTVCDTETIHFPTSGENADCDENTTIHMDAFLFDEDAVDDLCDAGKLSRNYCTQCGSHSTKPLSFITHSASPALVKFIFRHLLPDLQGKTVLDVGSRTGAVLYGAYLYSSAGRIVGVEIDPTFCRLQSSVLVKYNMGDRAQIIHGDIINQGEALTASDVVILNNVFEFFLPRDVQERIWVYLFSTWRPNTVLVTVPSLDEALQPLKTGIDLSRCVEQIDTETALQQAKSSLCNLSTDDIADLQRIHMYRVVNTLSRFQ